MEIRQEILIELICKAESGGLDEITEEKINEVLSSYLLSRYSKEEAKQGVKQTLDSLQKFLNRLAHYFSMSEKELKAKYDLMAKVEKLQASLPLGCDIADAEEVIEFARKLDKDFFNHSQVGILLGVQRQTVKSWIDKNKLASVPDGKRNLVSRDSLIKFYREYKKLEWNF